MLDFYKKERYNNPVINQYNNMTTDQKTTVFALASQILAAAKATENEKFAVHTNFCFGHSHTFGKELYCLSVSLMKKDKDGKIIRDENGIGESYECEDCPTIYISCSELFCDNCFEKMMEEMKKAAAKLGIIC